MLQPILEIHHLSLIPTTAGNAHFLWETRFQGRRNAHFPCQRLSIKPCFHFHLLLLFAIEAGTLVRACVTFKDKNNLKIAWIVIQLSPEHH